MHSHPWRHGSQSSIQIHGLLQFTGMRFFFLVHQSSFYEYTICVWVKELCSCRLQSCAINVSIWYLGMDEADSGHLPNLYTRLYTHNNLNQDCPTLDNGYSTVQVWFKTHNNWGNLTTSLFYRSGFMKSNQKWIKRYRLKRTQTHVLKSSRESIQW